MTPEQRALADTVAAELNLPPAPGFDGHWARVFALTDGGRLFVQAGRQRGQLNISTSVANDLREHRPYYREGEAPKTSMNVSESKDAQRIAAAAVFAGRHIQAQVQARFNAPIAAVGSQHFLGAEGGAGTRTEQILGLDLRGGVFLTVEAAGQTGGLLHERESHGLGRRVEGDEAARLGAAAIALADLNRVGFNLRGKKRAPNLGRVVARFWRRPSDCL